MVDGRAVGEQTLIGVDFAALGTVTTFSWLSTDERGRGLGHEMRCAVLQLAFTVSGRGKSSTVDPMADRHRNSSRSRRRSREGVGVKSLVFDLGGVVVVWDPVAPIAAAVGPERAEHFVHGGEFDFAAWNRAQDAGRSWDAAEAAAIEAHPHLAAEISAYRRNFPLALPELVPGTSEILRVLRSRGHRLVALTNWSAETFPHAPQRFPEVFALFDDVIVSGVEGVAKPDPAIFLVLARRLGHPLDGVLFVDDSLPNVDAARGAGMDAVHFTGAPALSCELRERALLD